MPPLARFILRYFWLFGILVTFVNVPLVWRRARKRMAEDPDLAPGYRRLMFWFFGLLTIPWVVMGVGMTIGGVPTVLHYFRPRDGDPYVLAWHSCVVLLWIVTVVWIYFKGGAETLVKYPGFFYPESSSPLQIKFFTALALLGGLTAMLVMWFCDLPIPNLAWH